MSHISSEHQYLKKIYKKERIAKFEKEIEPFRIEKK